MALDPDLISFFLRNIQRSDIHTFGSETAHLFEHLETEVKDNQVFDKYESERSKWANWLEELPPQWSPPEKFEDTKSLVYSLYRNVAEKGADGYEIPMHLSYEKEIKDAIYDFNNKFLEYLHVILNDIINANPELKTDDPISVSGDTVFIIHGHDNELKTELQLLLTRAGVNNIVLHEQPDKGRTIVDKLIQESKISNYAIALLSPDDTLMGGTNRARQNVILEVGYFMGMLGKSRVRLLKKGEIEIPSDLQGVLYENYDKSGAWKVKLCKELIAAGIHVDIAEVTKSL